MLAEFPSTHKENNKNRGIFMKNYEGLDMQVIFIVDDVLTNSGEWEDYSKDGTVEDTIWNGF